MTRNSRLTLTKDGERSFAHLVDSIARLLDELLRSERTRKKDLATKAGIDQAIVSRMLDGSRNVEARTVGAVFGALGYALDVQAKRIHPADGHPTNQAGATAEVKPDRLQTYTPAPKPAQPARVELRSANV
jgi:DNA-binding Xre family transcriptional regulator